MPKNNFAGRYIHHAELDKIIAKAVQEENEACALECDKKAQDYGGNNWSLASTCAEAIRERRKNNND